jgi:hypothetical protein
MGPGADGRQELKPHLASARAEELLNYHARARVDLDDGLQLESTFERANSIPRC